jgi:cellulose synthase/poly-beta-1,6-N-acetylglucosamine synthase-like glycosyltransferase
MKTLIDILFYCNYFVLSYFLIIGTIYLILNLVSFRNIFRYRKKLRYAELQDVFRQHNYKPITVIVPAYNKEDSIVDSVRSLLQMEYPDYQLVIVNDGSSDDTLKKLLENFKIRQVSFSPYYEIESKPIKTVYLSPSYPNLIVIDKQNGGKADSINAALNIANNPLIVVTDADSILERDCLLKITRPFIEDTNIVAVGGAVRISNGCKINKGYLKEVGLAKSWLARFQIIESLRTYLFGRNGFEIINGILAIPNSFGCFKREALIEIGGYHTGAISEEVEIIIRIHKELRKKNPKSKISFIHDPACWIEAPEDLKSLSAHRIRWHKGMIESMFLHKELFLNPRFSWLGILVYPYYTFFEVFGPLIEITGYAVFILSLLLNIIPSSFALAYISIVIVYGVVHSTLSIYLEELSFRKYKNSKQLIILVLASFLENFGYRQLTSFWRFRALINYLISRKPDINLKKKRFEKEVEKFKLSTEI